MTHVPRLSVLGLLFALAAGTLGAQGVVHHVPPPPHPAKQPAAQPQPKPPVDAEVARRAALQRQIRQELWRTAKQRIGFTDEQMTKLEQTSQHYDQRRRALNQEEKALRTSLRTETLADSSANQNTIATSMDRLSQLQHERIDLQADEQKDLASFMTPLQRAKFQALQEQFRQRVQELMRARPDSAGPSSPDPL